MLIGNQSASFLFKSHIVTNLQMTPKKVLLLAFISCNLQLISCSLDTKATSIDFNDSSLFYARNALFDLFDQNATFDEYITYSMQAMAKVAYFDRDLNKYDKKEDLLNSFARNESLVLDYETRKKNKFDIESFIDKSEKELMENADELTIFENSVNQQNCGRQIMVILRQLDKALDDPDKFAQSKQLALLDFLDSFGSAPGGQLLLGNHFWSGSPEQCTRARARLTADSTKQAELVEGRYCVADLRSPSWTHANGTSITPQQFGDKAFKIGICLPKSCNSISFLRHSQLIESLIRFARLKAGPLQNYKLTKLFCLPDESSPLRQFDSRGRLFLSLITIWFAFVLFFSFKYELAIAFGTAKPASETSKLTQIFAFRLAWNVLFDKQNTKQISNKSDPQAKRYFINLDAINGIKVISMMWLVISHTFMFLSLVIANARVFWSKVLLSPVFLVPMAGVFPVDSFFVVTGTLTTYLKFSKSDGASMDRARYWLELIVHRYLRFMPLYLVLFFYMRDVSRHVGSGPIWDYGTAASGLKAHCMRESVLEPLLFRANRKPFPVHCVMPAWYLANDFQFMLVTPIFMLVLRSNKWAGYLTLVSSTLASLMLQFVSTYYSKNFNDFEAVFNLKPTAPSYILVELWDLYGMPWNRIVPYLIGLLTGHLMYLENKAALRDSESKAKANQRKSTAAAPRGGPTELQVETTSLMATDMNGNLLPELKGQLDGQLDKSSKKSELKKETKEEREVAKTTTTSSFFGPFGEHVCLRIWTPISVLILVVFSPLASLSSESVGETARVGASLVLPAGRLLWSLAVSRLIYVCATSSLTNTRSFVIRFLSAPIWRPWSKIGLSVLLIQWEVITVFAQTQTSNPILTAGFVSANMLLCVLGSYSLGLVLYLTIEFPLAQIVELFIKPKLFSRNKS